MTRRALLAAAAGPFWMAARRGRAAASAYIVYVGTYTRKTSRGIFAYRFEPGAGKITPLGQVVETPNASWLVPDASFKYLYAVNESEFQREPGKPGQVSAFAVDRSTAKLTLLNRVSAVGGGPCHASLDAGGRFLFVANYGTGSIAVLPVEAGGRLGDAVAFVQHKGSSVNPQRQQGPHAHCIMPSPDNRFVLVADLGLDQILIYRFDAARGSLAPNDPPFARVAPGSGPRHFVFHPNGRLFYVVNEMANTVTAFNYDRERGALSEFQTISTLPEGYSERSTSAEILVDREGRFLYTSNRGHDSIAVFAIDPAKGTLSFVEHVSTKGQTPRGVALDPTGTYLFAANQQSDNVVLFRVNRQNGRLRPAGEVLTDATEPVAVVFVPAA